MRVLVACEESQAVCKAFRELGHVAYSCDIQECSGGHPEWHIIQDVLPLLDGNCSFKTQNMGENDEPIWIIGQWDLIIAHPPCTYLSNAGARWLFPNHELNQERYEKGLEAKQFFMQFFKADCKHICIENPIPSNIFELPKPTQIIQPYQFDRDGTHPYTKKTGLWLVGLPLLVPTTPNEIPVGPYCPSGTSRKIRSKYGAAKRGEDRKNRAKTFIGIAKAMSVQWSEFIE